LTNITIYNNYKAYQAAQKAGQRNIKFISSVATPEQTGFISSALKDTLRHNQACDY
jgi:hypothetical protein